MAPLASRGAGAEPKPPSAGDSWNPAAAGAAKNSSANGSLLRLKMSPLPPPGSNSGVAPSGSEGETDDALLPLQKPSSAVGGGIATGGLAKAPLDDESGSGGGGNDGGGAVSSSNVSQPPHDARDATSAEPELPSRYRSRRTLRGGLLTSRKKSARLCCGRPPPSGSSSAKRSGSGVGGRDTVEVGRWGGGAGGAKARLRGGRRSGARCSANGGGATRATLAQLDAGLAGGGGGSNGGAGPTGVAGCEKNAREA